MSARNGSKDQKLRQRIAAEAARIMADEGVRDFLAAKRKAAARVGVADDRFLPRNTEVEAALADYQRLFRADTQPGHLRALRETAREAMTFLERFQPRLVGSVLSGMADDHSDVNLHLFADTPEEVALFLMAEHIPYEERRRRLRVGREDYREYPAFRFLAGDHPIELVVFPLKGLRQAPWSPVDGRPMRRAARPALESLLAEEPLADPSY